MPQSIVILGFAFAADRIPFPFEGKPKKIPTRKNDPLPEHYWHRKGYYAFNVIAIKSLCNIKVRVVPLTKSTDRTLFTYFIYDFCFCLSMFSKFYCLGNVHLNGQYFYHMVTYLGECFPINRNLKSYSYINNHATRKKKVMIIIL